MRYVLPLAVLCCTPLFVSPAYATTAMEMSLEDIREASTIVVIGEVVQVESYWDGGLIITDSTVVVSECLRGECPTQVVVSSIGGQVGDIAQAVSGMGSYSPGSEVVAFLQTDAQERMITVGMAQGLFHLARMGGTFVARSDRSDLQLVDASGRTRVAPSVTYQLADLIYAVRYGQPVLPLTPEELASAR